MNVDTQQQASKRTIRELRDALNMTQFDLAVKSGVSLSTVINAENGTREPRVNNAIKIAKTLGVFVEQIIWGKSEDT